VLLRQSGCGAVLTVPFADGARMAGAVTFEWSQPAATAAATRERCEATLALVGPVLAALQRAGKIRHYGVSNLDMREMQEWWNATGGAATATNQLLYNLKRRGIEWDLLQWLRERRVPVMAYSPLEQARLFQNAKFAALAKASGITPAQLALAWLLAKDDVMVIPKCSSVARVDENAAARDIQLSLAQLAELDRIFPPPKGPHALEML